MRARTPEELETLFEDALITRDVAAVAALFEEGAVLISGTEHLAQGGVAIAALALATWSGDRVYVANPCQVMQARDVALIVTTPGINIMRRGDDGVWRYAIIVTGIEDGIERSE
jgi:ketosteroid isomerase-like protein